MCVSIEKLCIQFYGLLEEPSAWWAVAVLHGTKFWGHSMLWGTLWNRNILLRGGRIYHTRYISINFLMGKKKKQRLIYNIFTTTIILQIQNFLKTLILYLTLCTFGRICSSCKFNICYLTWLIRLDKLHHPQRMESLVGCRNMIPSLSCGEIVCALTRVREQILERGWGHGVPKITRGLSSSCWTSEKHGLRSPTFFTSLPQMKHLTLGWDLSWWWRCAPGWHLECYFMCAQQRAILQCTFIKGR